jgi:hypothetical protein
MVLFEIGSAMKPVSTESYEINILCHDCRQLLSVVLCPSVAKYLRQLSDGLIIRLSSCVRVSRADK